MTKAALLLSLLPCLAACSSGELVGLHIALRADGSAALTARALVESPTPSPAEVMGKGVAWSRRAALVYSQGSVTSLKDLTFGDDSLQIRERLDAQKLTVLIKPGPTAGWVNCLVPVKTKQQELSSLYDPNEQPKTTTGAHERQKELADTLRLEFALPSDVSSSSVLRTARGVEAGKERNRAYLIIPADTAREKGETIEWTITWTESTGR